jgi:hypothetical protein
LIKRSLFTNAAIDQKTAKLFLSFIESKLSKEERSQKNLNDLDADRN